MEKIDELRRLMDQFTPEEKDRIMEILRLALEITHQNRGTSSTDTAP